MERLVIDGLKIPNIDLSINALINAFFHMPINIVNYPD